MSKINKEQVKHIASLAKIELAEDELEKFTKEFESILEYVSIINNVEINDSVEIHNLESRQTNELYTDEVEESNITHDKITRNATKGRFKAGLISVSKIIDK